MRKFLKSKRALLLAAIIMALALVFNGAFFGLVHNMFMLKKLNKENAALDADYAKLTAEYGQILKGDEAYIEETARVKYHMAKEGETEFRLK